MLKSTYAVVDQTVVAPELQADSQRKIQLGALEVAVRFCDLEKLSPQASRRNYFSCTDTSKGTSFSSENLNSVAPECQGRIYFGLVLQRELYKISAVV